MTSGIGALGTGHGHPAVVEAIRRQAEQICFAQMSMFGSHEAQEEFVDKFLKWSPGAKLKGKISNEEFKKVHHNMFLFCNSGSEATENAVKVAKMHTQRPNVIAMHRGFHGRTFAAMSWSSSKTSYKSGFINTNAGTFFCPDFKPESFDAMLKHQTSPEETACVIIEPIQGEGGVRPVPKEFMQHLRKRCDEHGIMLIADEVQSGSGRTGTFWYCEQLGVVPDITAYGKAIGSGFPLAGISANKEAFGGLSKNALGGTYFVSPLGMAAGSATLDVIEDENLMENAVRMGDHIKEELQSFPHVTEVRHAGGLLLGVDLDPEVISAPAVIKRAATEEQMLLHSCGENALRIIPPYILNGGEC